tara:strand:- start:89 stop:256 length:168 start_codon:yes stop_codon:yes gene_type:complete
MWADHLTIARCCACMAEHDLTEAAALMGAGLHLLQRDLILESVRVDLVQEVAQSA